VQAFEREKAEMLKRAEQEKEGAVDAEHRAGELRLNEALEEAKTDFNRRMIEAEKVRKEEEEDGRGGGSQGGWYSDTSAGDHDDALS
jgi:hypothetical protein